MEKEQKQLYYCYLFIILTIILEGLMLYTLFLSNSGLDKNQRFFAGIGLIYMNWFVLICLSIISKIKREKDEQMSEL